MFKVVEKWPMRFINFNIYIWLIVRRRRRPGLHYRTGHTYTAVLYCTRMRLPPVLAGALRRKTPDAAYRFAYAGMRARAYAPDSRTQATRVTWARVPAGEPQRPVAAQSPGSLCFSSSG